MGLINPEDIDPDAAMNELDQEYFKHRAAVRLSKSGGGPNVLGMFGDPRMYHRDEYGPAHECDWCTGKLKPSAWVLEHCPPIPFP